MIHRVGWGLACLALVLLQAPEGHAQVRGKTSPSQRRAHPRKHPRRTPKPASPTPAPTGPWTAARARFIVSAESLAGAAHIRQKVTATAEGQTATATISGFSLHVLKGAELLDPFGQSRIGLDGVIEPGVTLGVAVGYSTLEQTTLGTTNTLSSFVIVPRLGYMLGPSRYLGVWLRAGVGYASLKAESPTSILTQRAVDLVLDPMLVITPLPHVGITVGPSLNIGLTGSTKVDEGKVDSTAASYGLSAGLALLF